MNLNTLRNEAAGCTLCDLHEGRYLPVFDKGNPSASVMICGVCPTNDENKTGIPFVGRAGKLLDVLLEASGFSLDTVYITNLVKCYLAAGKPLGQSWVDSCLPYIIAQINIIRPKVIITLGADVSNALLGRPPGSIIGEIRGRVFKYADGIDIIPTYHPSYLLSKGGHKSPIFPSVLQNFNVAKALVTQTVSFDDDDGYPD